MAAKRVILIGNEKGGTGKSTLAMNFIVYMMKKGKKVASVDLDGAQGTLTNYIKNRVEFADKYRFRLDSPLHVSIAVDDMTDPYTADNNIGYFLRTMEEMAKKADVIVIDTPGSHNYMMPAAHACADTIVTPLNDSVIDLDVIARVDPDSFKVSGSGNYAQTIWRARQERAKTNKSNLGWFVVKNRFGNLKCRHENQVDSLLQVLSKRMGFNVLDGMKERAVYRELFLKGLTVLDLKPDTDTGFNMSHIAARQEIRAIVEAVLNNKS